MILDQSIQTFDDPHLQSLGFFPGILERELPLAFLQILDDPDRQRVLC